MELLVIIVWGDQERVMVVQKLASEIMEIALPRDAICNSNGSNLSS